MNEILFKLLRLLPILGLCVESSGAISLKQAFEAAKSHRPSLLARSLDVEIAQRKKSVALSKFLPNIGFQFDSDWKDSISGSLASRSQQQVSRFTLDQPIYHGGAGFHGLSMASDHLKETKEYRRQAELDLFSGLSNTYLEVMTFDKELTVLEEQKDLLAKQVNLLRARARIGRSKYSESLSAESQLARVSVEILKAQNSRQIAMARLQWLTGLESIEPLESPVVIAQINPSALKNQRVLELPIIQAMQAKVEIGLSSVGLAQAAQWPDIDLAGNYYLDRQGTLSNSDWDVRLSLKWTLIDGRSTSNKIGVAKLKHEQLKLELNDLKNQKLKTFMSKKQSLLLNLKSIEALKKAVHLALRNYEEQQKEFSRGLVTHLDVLRALADHLELKRMHDRERFQTQLAWLQINLMLGVIP